ncbi:MAG: alpha/beta hydrolase [Christensenella sp.]|nr:alpha/beta hydrolase [Christensenella sp.]
MFKEYIKIGHIPAVIWGESSMRVFIAVHGDQSNKEDQVIEVFAQEATKRGYQVLSFDLPEHGDRKQEPTPCSVQICVKEFADVMAFARSTHEQVSLFACSMGAYFSLLAYRDEPLDQTLFLSPVVDMKRIIDNLMMYAQVTSEQLEQQKEIVTPFKTLYWDYYSYVATHPVVWDKKTALLYGAKDFLCEYSFVKAFADQARADMTVFDEGEHFFHTEEQIAFYRDWLTKQIAE